MTDLDRVQKDFLRANCRMPRTELAAAFNREFGLCVGVNSIQKLCRQMGLPNGRNYTFEQLDFLRENRTMPRHELTDLFNAKFNENRTAAAIESYCNKHGIFADSDKSRKYTKEQHEFLKEQVGSMTRDQLTILFNQTFGTSVSAASLSSYCLRQGMRRYSGPKRVPHKYTEEELQFLCKFSYLPSKELASLFNVRFDMELPESSIENICKKKGYLKGKNFYSEEQVSFLKENYLMPREHLTEAFNEKFHENKTVSAIAATCLRLGLIKGRDDYSEEQKIFLQENSYGRSRTELAALFNEKFGTCISENILTNYCNMHGWKSGHTGRFQKGDVPWHNGLRGKEVLSHFTEDSRQKALNALSPAKYQEGDEVIRHGICMSVVSTDYNSSFDERLKRKCRMVYEEAYGKIPEEHCIVFLDGNHRNFDINNLYCIPRRYIPLINHNHWLTDSREHTLAAIKLCELHYALKDAKK